MCGWACLNLIWRESIVFTDGREIETDFNINPPINIEFVKYWRKPATLPLWATRHFLRITGVETKAPCEFTEAEMLAEGIYREPWSDKFMDIVPPFWTFDGSWILDGDEPILDAWKALWLSLHPKDGEQTFERPHTVYTFELCK